jgi:hypothetical protein
MTEPRPKGAVVVLRLPGARTLDLRLEDRITAVEDK